MCLIVLPYSLKQMKSLSMHASGLYTVFYYICSYLLTIMLKCKNISILLHCSMKGLVDIAIYEVSLHHLHVNTHVISVSDTHSTLWRNSKSSSRWVPLDCLRVCVCVCVCVLSTES